VALESVRSPRTATYSY